MTSLTRSGGGPTDTFAYNGMGARVRRTDAAWGLRIYTRDGLMPASDVLFDGGMNFTPGISQRSGGGQDLYYNDDALGSVTDMTDLNGNIATTRKWDAFGNKSGTVSTHLRGWNEGSGYEEDSASGLRLLGYRYYDPSIGRFLSPDPIGDGSNWYAYCGNDPLGFVDPIGLQWKNASELDGSYFQHWWHYNVTETIYGWGNALHTTAGFLLGIGPSGSTYDEDTVQVSQMRKSDIGYSIMNNIIGSSYMRDTRTLRGHVDSGPAFLSTIFQPTNGTQAQVGGCTWKATRVGNKIYIRVHNEISMYSLFYHFANLTKWQGWHRAKCGFGPMGIVTQDFDWTEDVPPYYKR